MATELNSEEHLNIELALRRLNADFCYYLDHRDTDRLVDLFTAGARYSHGERLSEGRDAIADLFDHRHAAGVRTARHLQSGLRIDIRDSHSATGSSVCATFAADELPPIFTATPHLVADFEDEYERCDDGRWRISRRHIERIFLDPQNEGPIGAG
jgi:hypothetical protein